MANTPLGAGDALIVVDVQNDFLPGGSMAVPRGDEIIERLNRVAAHFRSSQLPVFFTRDWHPLNHVSFQGQGGPWPQHCVAGTWGAEPPSSLELRSSDRILLKATGRDEEAYSAFHGTNLDAELRAGGVRRLFVGGLATEYCVRCTVKDALTSGYAVIVLEDAVRALKAGTEDEGEAKAEMRQLGAVLANSGYLNHAHHQRRSAH